MTRQAFARLELPVEANLPGDSYRLHPVTDSGFRIAEAIFPDEDPEQIYVPFGISSFSCDHAASGTVWVKQPQGNSTNASRRLRVIR